MLRQVLGQGLVLAGIGVAAGVAVSLGLTRFLTSLLYGITPTDPATFLGVSAALLLTAAAAGALPACRASRLDPMAALRHE